MINERQISEKFHSIWKLHFPLLNSNFIKIINETYLIEINQPSIETIDSVRYDLISECSFNISQQIYETKEPIKEFISNTNNLSKIVEKTAQSIWINDSYDEKDLRLSLIEVKQIIGISENIISFIESFKPKHVEFRPKLKGYGYITNLEGDIVIDDTLYEVKTVKRKFRTSDLKQLMIYLALQQADHESKNWETAGLFNPRKSVYCQLDINSFVYSITGGKSPNEAFIEFLNSLTRDLQVDSKF